MFNRHKNDDVTVQEIIDQWKPFVLKEFERAFNNIHASQTRLGNDVYRIDTSRQSREKILFAEISRAWKSIEELQQQNSEKDKRIVELEKFQTDISGKWNDVIVPLIEGQQAEEETPLAERESVDDIR